MKIILKLLFYSMLLFSETLFSMGAGNDESISSEKSSPEFKKDHPRKRVGASSSNPRPSKQSRITSSEPSHGKKEEEEEEELEVIESRKASLAEMPWEVILSILRFAIVRFETCTSLDQIEVDLENRMLWRTINKKFADLGIRDLIPELKKFNLVIPGTILEKMIKRYAKRAVCQATLSPRQTELFALIFDNNFTFSKTKCSVLLLASIHNHPELIQKLLDANVLENMRNKHLLNALLSKNESLIANLLKKCQLIHPIPVSHCQFCNESPLTNSDFLGNDYTALAFAAALGNQVIFQMILQHYIENAEKSPHALEKFSLYTEEMCIYPLSLACKYGHLPIVKSLLSSGLPICPEEETTPLVIACRYNQLEIARYLLEEHPEIDLNLKEEDGSCALLYACKWGNLELVKALLKKGDEELEVNSSEEGYLDVEEITQTPLIIAAFFGNVEIVKELLNHPQIDINLGCKVLGTPLHIACLKGHLEIVNLLAQRQDLNLNCQNEKGETALMLAVRAGNLAIVKALLQHDSIKVNIQNAQGQTVLMLACSKELGYQRLSDFTSEAVMSEDLKIQLIEALLQRPDHDLAIVDKKGFDVLLYALLCSSRQIENLINIYRENKTALTFVSQFLA